MFPAGKTFDKRKILARVRSLLSPLWFSNIPNDRWTVKSEQILKADQNLLVSIALSEATCILSIERRLMIPYTGGNEPREVENRRQALIRLTSLRLIMNIFNLNLKWTLKMGFVEQLLKHHQRLPLFSCKIPH